MARSAQYNPGDGVLNIDPGGGVLSIDAGNCACGHAGIDEEIDGACTRGDGVRGRPKKIDAALACTAVAYTAVDEGIDTACICAAMESAQVVEK